jgi:hypothetical protein
MRTSNDREDTNKIDDDEKALDEMIKGQEEQTDL